MKVVFSGFPDWAVRSQVEVEKWLGVLSLEYGRRIGHLHYSFVDDAEIVTINQRYLSHNYATDIITFEYSDGNYVSGDIFISLDTVVANSKTFKVTRTDELERVIVHGLLHLMGFNDKDEEERLRMKEEEDKCLILRPKIIGDN